MKSIFLCIADYSACIYRVPVMAQDIVFCNCKDDCSDKKEKLLFDIEICKKCDDTDCCVFLNRCIEDMKHHTKPFGF